MTNPNDRQVGGMHYLHYPYQHWDLVCDINMHYLLACATGYVSRHRSKGGAKDLSKALHFIEKYKSKKIWTSLGEKDLQLVHKFCMQLHGSDSPIVMALAGGDTYYATRAITLLIGTLEYQLTFKT